MAAQAKQATAETAPVITLKNVTYSQRLSHETPAFAATVYVDGQRFCAVENDGHGGPDHFTPFKGDNPAKFQAKIDDLEARIKRTSEPVDVGDGITVEPSFELLIASALDRYLNLKAAAKELSSYYIGEREDGTLVSYSRRQQALKGKALNQVRDSLEAAAASKGPRVKRWLNDLPTNEAAAILLAKIGEQA